jgi:hypothetical protein
MSQDFHSKSGAELSIQVVQLVDGFGFPDAMAALTASAVVVAYKLGTLDSLKNQELVIATLERAFRAALADLKDGGKIP